MNAPGATRDAAANDPEVLRVDWDAYYELIERLAVQVLQSGYAPESLLCLARGGLRAGDVLSRVLRLPLGILATSSYREAGGTVAGAMDIAERITYTGSAPHGRLLLIDDMVDSGRTVVQVREYLAQRYPAVSEVRIAVIWFKGASIVAPDFYAQHLPHSPWIVQPFEVYDQLDAAALPARWGGSGA